MRSRTGVVVGLVAAILTGCGRDIQLPDKPAAGTTNKAGPANELPKVSDPAAKALIDKAVEAQTGGAPSRLARAKVHRMTVTGQMDKQGTTVATTRQTAAVWPQQARFTYLHEGAEVPQILIVLNGPQAWLRGSGPASLVNPAVREVLQTESYGQYWVGFLFPLTDPEAVVYAPGEFVAAGQTFKTVKVAAPGRPPLLVGFDAKTGHLARVAFDGRDISGAVARRALAVSEYKEFDGVRLPGKLDCYIGERLVETYKVESLTFPDAIDAKEFDQP